MPKRELALLLAAIAFGTYYHLTTRDIDHPPGILAAKDPEQGIPAYPTPIVKGEFTLQPRATLAADVRILSRERYYLGSLATIAPLDLAVGWGPMSDSAVLAPLKISQGQRFYFWRYENEPPVPREVIETHSANWHVLAANNAVWRTLRSARVGDVVHLDGFLVDIDGPDMETMRTSVTRTDTGAGACEIVYVKSVSIAGR